MVEEDLGITDMTYEDNRTPVTEFYDGRSVLITGGTGFLGKVLIEKILRSTNVKSVFILLRSKNGRAANERLAEITDCKIFNRLKEKNPEILNKIIAVSGDVCLPELGLSIPDREALLQNVSVVFHSAAEVRFVEPLKLAIEINVCGTRRVLKFCQGLPLIEAFVHVSTAYSNCQLKEIEEKVYATGTSYQNIKDSVSWMSKEALEALEPHIMEGRPNTYTFSKALAENVLANEGGNIPICIVRPSIVIGAYREPLIGWVEGFNGPIGLTAVLSKGVLRSAYVKTEMTLDVVPVDLVINLLIVAAWKTAIDKALTPAVYNLTSGELNPFTMGMIKTEVLPAIYKWPCQELYRFPGVRLTNSRVLQKFDRVVDHYIPGYIADFIAKIAGYKPGMIKLTKKIYRELGFMNHFYLNQWVFHGNNVADLVKSLSPKERQIFNFEITSFKWKDAAESFVIGVREFILNDDPSTVPTGMVMLKRWYVVQKVVDLLALGAVVKIALDYSEFFIDVFQSALNWFF